MLNRRNFLKSSGAIGLSALFLPHAEAALFNFANRPLGVQLFTLFDTIDADVQGSLKKVAAIGYTEIESAFSKQGGYYGMTPKQFAALCKSLGLHWKSHHVLGAPFKQAAEGGISFLVCANTPTATTAEIKSSIQVLTKTGEACKKAGLQLCYHNHDMEFKIVDGKTPYSMLLDEINPELLKFELDLAWATKAKVDIPAMFAKHEGRFPLLHIKDITADSVLGPVGSGIVDFKTVFANASIGGVKHYFVEHDMPKDAYASLTQSYKALRAMGL
jgi:sugar phosphate isomerase/epimerase